jgi:hypothetical protein
MRNGHRRPRRMSWGPSGVGNNDLEFEERLFLRLLARFGPLMTVAASARVLRRDTAESLLDAVKQKTVPLTVIKVKGRHGPGFFATRQVAAYLASNPGAPIPEVFEADAEYFSNDVSVGGDVLWLGVPLEPRRVRALSLDKLTHLTMHAMYGPVMETKDAAVILGFNSADSFVRAVAQRRVPMGMFVPPGRRRAFISTRLVALFVSRLAAQAEQILATRRAFAWSPAVRAWRRRGSCRSRKS